MASVPHKPEQELRDAGLRVTGQRTLILDILRRSSEHLDAEEIYAKARAEGASLSLATVYRTVKALRGVGLIEQQYFGPEHSHDHYEVGGGPEHYHFACDHCGRIFEFETRLVQQLRAELNAQYGWDVDETVLSFRGTCRDCAGSGQTSDRP